MSRKPGRILGSEGLTQDELRHDSLRLTVWTVPPWQVPLCTLATVGTGMLAVDDREMREVLLCAALILRATILLRTC